MDPPFALMTSDSSPLTTDIHQVPGVFQTWTLLFAGFCGNIEGFVPHSVVVGAVFRADAEGCVTFASAKERVRQFRSFLLIYNGFNIEQASQETFSLSSATDDLDDAVFVWPNKTRSWLFPHSFWSALSLFNQPKSI